MVHRAVAVALLAAAPAAAVPEDNQLWVAAVAQGSFGNRGALWLEVQPRLTDDASRLGQLILRPGIGLTIRPGTTLLVGYHYQRNDPEGGSVTHEHRLWQQLLAPLWRRDDGAQFVLRLRLEERTIVGAGDLGWRLRTQLRFAAPLAGRGSVGFVGWSEYFHTFNDTDWGQERGPDQWRNFVGIGIPVGKVTVEPGYMNQYLWRRRGDRMNHVANILINYRF